ncbi:vWA domain-containing protein, partial [Streptomyces roseifaciens]
MSGNQNYINHVALVLDASSSMSRLSRKVVEVADQQIAYLARRSQELDQETRVTVYVFANTVECVIYDKDVLRMPSLKQLYQVSGMTALLAAALKSQRELAQTAQLYGDHSFLTFVLTDGQENASHRCPDAPARDPRELVQAVSEMIATQDDNWTLAVLVPDQIGKREAMQYGFPKDNIAIWDATSTQGLEEAGQVIQQATEKFMIGRTQGIRGTRAVFSTGAEAVNKETIKAAGLTPVKPSEYQLIPVTREAAIREWVTESGYTYRTGCAFYQLSKTEKVQAKKQIAVLEKKTDRVYTGPEARALLGLPDME